MILCGSVQDHPIGGCVRCFLSASEAPSSFALIWPVGSTATFFVLLPSVRKVSAVRLRFDTVWLVVMHILPRDEAKLLLHQVVAPSL
jgi:hypothetical protein